MKSRRGFLQNVLIDSSAVAALAAARSGLGAELPGPRPKYLTYPFSKDFHGFLENPSLSANSYPCAGFAGEHASMFEIHDVVLNLKVGPRGPCDGFPGKLNGLFRAVWGDVFARNGDPNLYGFHDGTFVWSDGESTTRGLMIGTIGLDAHRVPPEVCYPRRHFEGRLDGTIESGPFARFAKLKGGPARLTAIYSGTIDPDWTALGKGRAAAVLLVEGVVILPC
jgi:hypothetical protein